MSHLATFLGGCLIGVLGGSILGVLIAPHRGEITRRKLKRRIGEMRDQIEETVDDLSR